MPKTLTIELPDNLEQHLGLSASATDDSLKGIILNALSLLAELMRSLQDSDARVRAQSAERLGDLRVEISIQALSKALYDDEVAVRHSAEEALQKIGTPEALTLLNEYLSIKEATPVPDPDYAPLLALIGTIELDITDLGENHDSYIATAIERKLT